MKKNFVECFMLVTFIALSSCGDNSNKSSEDINSQQVVCSDCGGSGFVSDIYGNTAVCQKCSGLGSYHRSYDVSFTGHGACSHYDALRKERCDCPEYSGNYEKSPCSKCGHKYTEHN